MKFGLPKNPFVAAFAGMLALPAFFLATMFALNSADFIVADLREIWPYLALMSIGFGAQAGMHAYIRNYSAGGGMAASAGVPGAAMAACCAHHAADLLAAIGLAAIAGVLGRYRIPLLILGVFSNVIGIIWMLAHLQKHGMVKEKSAWRQAMRIEWGRPLFHPQFSLPQFGH